MLADAVKQLRTTIKSTNRVEVIYRRVNGLARCVTATIGRTEFGLSEQAAIVTKWESRDFLIDVADLAAVGITGEPQRGDTIRERQGESVHVYEVRAPDGEQHWRYSDAYRMTFRIHTKQVGIE